MGRDRVGERADCANDAHRALPRVGIPPSCDPNKPREGARTADSRGDEPHGMALIATVRSGEAIPSALGSNPQARHRAPGSPVSPPGRPTPPISSLATAAAGKWKILDTTHILWGTNRTRWASSSPDQAADVAEGPAVGPGERPYRPVGRVAHTDQVDGGVAVGESQDPLSPLWLMTAEWPEPMPRPAAASSIMFAVAWPKSYISQSRCRSSSGSLATRAIGAADW